MRTLLCLLLVFVVFLLEAEATTYSCRDSKGQLHITDNLQALPEECRGKAQVIQSGETPDNLNFVPQIDQPKGSGAEFQQNVREADRALQQKREKVEEYVRRAAELAEEYRSAEQEKRQATRRWSYRSRDIIRQADDRLERVRQGKKQLLKELRGQRIPSDKEKGIRADLDVIVDK